MSKVQASSGGPRRPFARKGAVGGRVSSEPMQVKKGRDAQGRWGLAASFVDSEGLVDLGRVADAFRMSRSQMAETAGLAQSTVAKTKRHGTPRTQARVMEILEIINRVKDWAGGEAQAMAWFRSQPIPALDGRTPEALVKAGRAGAVREYLDHMALGGYA